MKRIALFALVLVAAGCGGDEEYSARPEPDVGGVIGAQVETCKPGTVHRLGSGARAYAAVVKRNAVAYRRPGKGRLARFGELNVNGVPNVFSVRAAVVGPNCKPLWYRVQLPMKPNGIVGYVRARDVQVESVETRIVVDLSDRRVTLFRKGRKVLDAPVAIGSTATPTPTGSYYVNQRLIPEDTSGPFGPGAIGVSAFSPVLTGWAQGGPIAIHGTNRPDLIGQAVSNGCIRVENKILKRMFEQTLSGTPVIIRA